MKQEEYECPHCGELTQHIIESVCEWCYEESEEMLDNRRSKFDWWES